MAFSTNSSDNKSSSPLCHSVSMESVLAPLVSVVIPTFKEAENLPILIPQVCRALDRSGMTGEILVVDDNSPDATVSVCEKLRAEYPVRLLVRTRERGLSSAVVHGLNQARGSVLVVMDADLSHPPATVPELVAAVLEQQGDFVIGSRYVRGGTTDDQWGLFRWLNSQVATWLSRGLTSAKDPMAGFFALSRQTFEQAQQLSPIGYKIGLELIVKCGCNQVAEIPIHFQDRLHGESKLSLKEQLNYLRHLGRLYRHKLGGWFAPLAFGMVGFTGTLIDLLLLTLLMLVTTFPVARAVAIWGAMSWNYWGNRRVTFADRKQESPRKQYLKFCGSCLLGATVSWGISTFVWQNFSHALHSPQVAALTGILGGVVLNYLLSNYFVFQKKEQDLSVFLGTPLQNEAVVPTETSLNDTNTNSGVSSPALQKRLVLCTGAAVLLALALGLTSFNWFRQEIDGLDQAHNVLTSLYFYDMLQDQPGRDLVHYTYDYQRQYPALGLMFWPPLFHAVTGSVMLLTGPQILTVHWVLAGFVVLFTLTMYFSLARELTVPGAVLAVALTLTTPILFQLENSVMLELPSLAMAFLALLLYVQLIRRGAWQNAGEAILAGVCCALIAYTKQPAVFVLGGIFLDVLLHHRQLLKSRLTAICLATAVGFLLPLAAFTWKFGQVNLAQSLGNQGNIYVAHHRVAERWSVEGWTYYFQLLPEQLPLLALLFSGLGLLVMLIQPEQRRKHGIWLCCFVAWYLMFSYFDNKQVRFVAYAIPFLCIAAVVACQWLMQQKQYVGVACLCLLLIPVAQNASALGKHRPQGYQSLNTVMTECLRRRAGNFVFFGEDYHLFTAQLRLLDPQRERAMVRGDVLLAGQQMTDIELAQALRDYRVRWIFVDPELPIGQQIEAVLQSNPSDFQWQQKTILFDNGLKPFPLRVYEYQGVLAETMRQVPLRSVTAEQENL